MRGYEPADVREFLDEVAGEWDQMNARNRELQTKLVELETQVRDFRQVEQVLQQALKKAEETSKLQMELTRQQSEATLREADLQAARLIDTARNEASDIQKQIIVLEQTRTDLLNRLEGMLTTFSRNVSDFRINLKESVPAPPVHQPVPSPVPEPPKPELVEPVKETVPIPAEPKPAPKKFNLDHLLNTLD